MLKVQARLHESIITYVTCILNLILNINILQIYFVMQIMEHTSRKRV